MTDLSTYGQYKHDIFQKLGVHFAPGKKLLDVGCGDGTDAEIFIKAFHLATYGIDVYEDDNIKKVTGLQFQRAGISQIPFPDNTFDYIFLHDVLHHIDEAHQSYDRHVQGLRELVRVVAPGGSIIIVEGNRYNPLFYPHMVLLNKHNHFRQPYFRKIITDAFAGQDIQFKFFESHVYPPRFLRLWKLYERLMERLSPKGFLAYNVAIVKKNK